MIYNIDTIPAKTFFKIQETNNVKLLTDDDKIEEKELVEAWGKLHQDYAEKTNKKKANQALKIHSKIQELQKKYLIVIEIINLLKTGKRDKELEGVLKKYNYKLSENAFESDLQVIKKNSNSIKIRISKYEADLRRLFPEEDSNNIQKFNYEKSLMSMCVILSMGYVNSSAILLIDYINMIDLTEQKLKALEKQESKK